MNDAVMDSSDSSGGKPEEPAEDEETTTTTTMTMIRAAVEAVHSSPSQAVLYLTGGASQALGWLMSVPGASSTVLEAVVPYSRMSTIQLLGKNPAQFCSKQVAEELALLAYNRALKLSRIGDGILSVISNFVY